MIDAPRNCDPPRRQERWCRQQTLVVCHRIKLVNGPAGGFGGNRARRLVEARCRPRTGRAGSSDPAAVEGCAVARAGVCNETGRNSEPGANPAETLATHYSTQSRDTTLASDWIIGRSRCAAPTASLAGKTAPAQSLTTVRTHPEPASSRKLACFSKVRRLP